MELATAEFLVSPDASDFLREARLLRDDRVASVTVMSRLRKKLSIALAAAVWELALVRQRAVAKVGAEAECMFFDREGLEMGSGHNAANYHARRFVDAGAPVVIDLCGGAGLDTYAFARAGISSSCYELDPARARFITANAEVLGLSDKIGVFTEDSTAVAYTLSAFFFFDPARRSEARRWTNAFEQTRPPLTFVDLLRALDAAGICVKASPAIDLRIAQRFDADVELISDQGECKEALFWTGKLQNGTKLAATLLGKHQTIAGDLIRCRFSPEPGTYLWEPDPAVIRGGLVPVLAERIDAWQRDVDIPYLFSNSLSETPFARSYEILEEMPWDQKRVQTALRSRKIGRVIVKKRAFPLEPEQIQKQLKLDGDQEGILVVCRLSKQLRAFIVSANE